jgi:hypothetical protein
MVEKDQHHPADCAIIAPIKYLLADYFGYRHRVQALVVSVEKARLIGYAKGKLGKAHTQRRRT